jgi:hypothetical protein
MILFKSDNEQAEWNQLHLKNMALRDLLMAVAIFVKHEFNKDVVLTEVYRTKAENDALYAATPPEQRPGDSPHMHWEAIDIRSQIYTPVEIQRILEFVNCFRYKGKHAAVYHAIRGNAPHFHLQYCSAS